jgi:hypothetical protein
MVGPMNNREHLNSKFERTTRELLFPMLVAQGFRWNTARPA